MDRTYKTEILYIYNRIKKDCILFVKMQSFFYLISKVARTNYLLSSYDLQQIVLIIINCHNKFHLGNILH